MPAFTSLVKMHTVFASAMAVAAVLLASGVRAQDAPAKAPMAKLMQAPPGRVIFDFGAKPKAVASAPASAAVAGATSSGVESRGTVATPATPATATATATESKFDFLGSLPPPSGRSLNSARRLDAPDQGVVIKDAPKTGK